MCDSESYKMDLILDVNTQLYPVQLGQWKIVHLFPLGKRRCMHNAS